VKLDLVKIARSLIEKKVPLISIDSDVYSAYRVLQRYLAAKALYPNEEIRVYISSSKLGLHVKIFKQACILEDLIARAMLSDDAYRLVYAIRKLALSEGEEEFVDLCFDWKEEGYEIEINIEAILEPYREEVEKALELLREGKFISADEIIRELAEKVKDQLEIKQDMYVGCIAFNGDDVLEEVRRVCEDIVVRDETFKYHIYPSYFPEWEYVLAIFDNNKDRCWRKITWFVNKVPILRERRERGEIRFWVKERVRAHRV